MSIEDYNRQRDVKEVPSQGKLSPIRELLEQLFDMVVRLDHEGRFSAGYAPRVGEGGGYGNGYIPDGVANASGSLNSLSSKISDTVDIPLYRNAVNRGQRSREALLNVAAECYIEGVYTHDISKIFKPFGIESMSSTEVSNTSKKLDEGFEPWRNRDLGEFPYLILNAGYEKLRVTGIVRDVAVLTAVGVDREGNRRILGVSVELKDAELHWREFLDGLVHRGIRGVEYIVSDDYPGLKVARRAVLTGSKWQRCQHNFVQDALKQAPNEEIRKCLVAELRTVCNAETIKLAERALENLVTRFSSETPTLAKWLETNVPDTLTVYSLPTHHRVKMRTSNRLKHVLNQQIKQRTRLIRIFPNPSSLLRLVTSVIIEIDEEWIGKNRRHIAWNR